MITPMDIDIDIDKTQETTKMWATTKELLKLAAALNGETMSAMAHRLIEAEYKRVAQNFASKESV